MFRTTPLATVFALLCAVLIAPSVGCGGGGGGGGGSQAALLTPKVSSVSPSNGATDISIASTQVTATFDSAMNPATIDATTFIVEDVTGAPVARAGTITYDANLLTATWTLTEVGLNSQFPTDIRFKFDTIYQVRLTNGIRGANGLPIVPAVTTQFRTAATEFGIVASGTDPQNGAAGVLIDPFRTVVTDGGGNSALVFATLKVRIDVALNPLTVNNTNVVLRLNPSGTQVPAGVWFDVPSNTIFVAPAAGANPQYPSEPLLNTATAYTLVITTAVQSAQGTSPTQPVTLNFTTIVCKVRAPGLVVTSPGNTDLVLSEAFAGPTPSNAESDSNGDGTVSLGNDEFSEVVNVSGDYLDLMGHKLADSSNIGVPNGQLIQWDNNTLPVGTRHLALLAPGCSIVVWNGPGSAANVSTIPAGIPFSKVTIGHSKAFFAGKFSGGLLGNTGDSVLIQQLSPAIGSSGNVLNDAFALPSNQAPSPLASFVRSGGISGGFESHRTASVGGTIFSPGLQTNGAVYP